jgi:hypothetical protein
MRGSTGDLSYVVRYGDYLQRLSVDTALSTRYWGNDSPEVFARGFEFLPCDYSTMLMNIQYQLIARSARNPCLRVKSPDKQIQMIFRKKNNFPYISPISPSFITRTSGHINIFDS